MKDKKGFLLAEETLKIVIALISIGFLAYFLSALYFSSQNSKGLEFAEASLEHLVNEINSGSDNVEIYNPEDWVLVSFPIGDVRPKSCFNLGWEKCLCICDEAFNTLSDSGLAEDCDDVGICLESDSVVVNGKIKLENPPVILNIDENKKIT